MPPHHGFWPLQDLSWENQGHLMSWMSISVLTRGLSLRSLGMLTWRYWFATSVACVCLKVVDIISRNGHFRKFISSKNIHFGVPFFFGRNHLQLQNRYKHIKQHNGLSTNDGLCWNWKHPKTHCSLSVRQLMLLGNPVRIRSCLVVTH